MRLMTERGVGVRQLAREVYCNPGHISNLRNGRARPSPELAKALDNYLGGEGNLAALISTGAVIAVGQAPEPTPDAEMIRRALEDALTDGMMSAGLLDDWDAVVTRYGYRTRDTPSPLLLADLTADLAELRLAISRHRSASALPRLALIAARMSGLVCLTLIKAGDRQAWRRWGRTARHAAGEAADGSALSWATAQEAYGHFYAGDMPGAVACARSALDASRAPCVGAVLAAALEMRAHAVMGDGPAAMRMLDTAERIHAGLSGGDLASSAFGYGENQLRFHAGDALTQLGDTAAAFPMLDRALGLCAPDDYTDWAMIRFDRAECLIRDGDTDAGLAYAGETMLALDGLKRQGIIIARGRKLLAALTPAQRSSRAACVFCGLLDDTTGMKEMTI